jgi:hypothetical protein
MSEWKLKTWKINPSKLQNWKRLDPNFPKEKATDCAVNAMSYLGVFDNLQSDEEVKLKSYILNITRGSTSLEERIGTIYDKMHLFIQEKHDVKCVKDLVIRTNTNKLIMSQLNCEEHVGFLNKIDSLINNGEYTLFDFYRCNGTGHSVVLGKIDDTIYIIDPQQERLYKEQEKMDIDNNNNCIDVRSISSLFENYLINQNAIGASFILVKETGKRTSTPPFTVRKSNTSNGPFKKQRITKGGKKKKTIKKHKKKSGKKKKKGKKKKTIKKHKKKSGRKRKPLKKLKK